jgi:site-specific DNA-methyltransferase (adenine-specific)
MFSFVGDTVLDPFLGSGTTSLAAHNLERNSVGYEIKKELLPLIRNKLISGSLEVIFEKQSPQPDFKAEIASLPYIFKDLVRFDKKVDPRQLSFGSKINGKEESNERLYSVKRVEAPDLVELSGGLRVRLLGVKPIAEKKDEAMTFIQQITKGQKVFLKFDEYQRDEGDMLLAYLYLKNKTFVNMHLIKKQLVEVDTTRDYRAKNRFLNNSRENGSLEVPA